jgi:hypothetical protein
VRLLFQTIPKPLKQSTLFKKDNSLRSIGLAVIKGVKLEQETVGIHYPDYSSSSSSGNPFTVCSTVL